MAYALRALGKEVRVVNARPGAAAAAWRFPACRDIEIADRVDGDFDAAIVMECGDLARTGVAGLERFFVINIDHHPGQHRLRRRSTGSTPSAAACGEMVFDADRARSACR